MFLSCIKCYTLTCSFENTLALSLWPDCFKPHLLVLKDILGRISRQPSELESHADHLYDTILASLDTLAGCTLIPENTPMAHRNTSVKGISLVSRATQENICPCAQLGYRAPAVTVGCFLEACRVKS